MRMMVLGGLRSRRGLVVLYQARYEQLVTSISLFCLPVSYQPPKFALDFFPIISAGIFWGTYH